MRTRTLCGVVVAVVVAAAGIGSVAVASDGDIDHHEAVQMPAAPAQVAEIEATLAAVSADLPN